MNSLRLSTPLFFLLFALGILSNSVVPGLVIVGLWALALLRSWLFFTAKGLPRASHQSLNAVDLIVELRKFYTTARVRGLDHYRMGTVLWTVQSIDPDEFSPEMAHRVGNYSGLLIKFTRLDGKSHTWFISRSKTGDAYSVYNLTRDFQMLPITLTESGPDLLDAELFHDTLLWPVSAVHLSDFLFAVCFASYSRFNQRPF